MSVKIPCCSQMQYALDESDVPLAWIRKFREIGLLVLDGGDGYIVLSFCPWCGNRLPGSLRNEWFKELERRDIDPYGEDVPAAFLDETWHKALESTD